MADLEAPEVNVSADVPSFSDVAPEATASLAATDKARTELMAREALLSGREGELAEAREKGLAGPRAALEASAAAPLPNAPGMSPLPEAPSGPIIDPEHFKNYAAIALPFSLLLGAVARADAVQGLNMLSSSVQGYIQGRHEVAAQQLEQFKAKMAKVTQDNKQKLEEYRNILMRRDLENQQKQQLLAIAAQKYDDAGMYYASQHKTIADQFKRLDLEDRNTMRLANESVKIASDYEKNMTQRQHYIAMEQTARERVQKMGSMKGDAQTQKKLQWLQNKQVDLYKEFMSKMSALSTKVLPASQRKLAETQIRNWFAGAMKNTNQIGRQEGFTIPPELEAMENPANDPLGPTSTPASEEQSQSFFRSLWADWGKNFGAPPGVQPGVPQPPQGPTGGGGWSATPR